MVVINVEGESRIQHPNIEEIHEEKRIVSWEEKDDYPHWKEYKNLNIDIDFNDDLYDLMIEHKAGLTISRDKLFGWPCWIQWADDFVDSETGKQKEYLFQIVSEDNIPYLFGDCGIGYLIQDPKNRDDLSFYWA